MRHGRKLSFITCMHSFTQITSRIELRGIVPSNQIKVTFIIILFYPSAWFVFDFFLFHIEIEGNCGWIIGGGGGGGGGGGLAPSQIIGWASPPLTPPPPHLPTPMKHLNNKTMDTKHRQTPHPPPPPLPTPMKHLNNKTIDTKHRQIQKEYLLKEVLIEKKN